MSINMVVIQGMVNVAPEVQTLKGGQRAVFRVQTRESRRDKRGVLLEQNEVHICVARGHMADTVRASVGAGTEVFIHGRLHTRWWFDKKSESVRQSTEVWILGLTVKSQGAAGDPSATLDESDFRPAEGAVPDEELLNQMRATGALTFP